MLSFRILGPLEIVAETGIIRLRGSKQCALLATLLTSPGRLVPIDSLIAEVWGEDHPARAENDLQAHVSRLRRQLAALEPGRADSRVITHVSGYEIAVGDKELDAARFVAGLDEISGLAQSDPASVVCRLRRLLGLWRGRAFGNMERGPVCQAASARYEEHRITAYQMLFEHELRGGNYARIIPELRDLLTQYEFHERFWQQLMIALYRSGRQADALSVYRDLGRRLSDELGLDPSPAMRQYEQAVLDHHPAISQHGTPAS